MLAFRRAASSAAADTESAGRAALVRVLLGLVGDLEGVLVLFAVATVFVLADLPAVCACWATWWAAMPRSGFGCGLDCAGSAAANTSEPAASRASV